VVYNVAIVLEHIHSSGVVNGDVYLHNILQCGESGSKVSDFGASFVYDRDKYPIFERIEVLAFGRLVQDLFLWHLDTAITDTTEHPQGTKTLEKGLFSDLMELILQPNQLGRPSFRDIQDTLSFLPEFSAAASRLKDER
jgi:serine/threonine protein kinase